MHRAMYIAKFDFNNEFNDSLIWPIDVNELLYKRRLI